MRERPGSIRKRARKTGRGTRTEKQPAEKFMNGRHPRTPASSPASRTQGALIHRGPGAIAATHSLTAPFDHAPNDALLIDLDNVTMGIRSDIGKELRTLLSSDIIKGKVT